MEVSYLGKSKVRIATRTVKIEVNDDVITFPGAADLVIDTPGEYEVKGMMITGVPVGESTAYVIQSDTASFGVLTHVSEELNAEALEQLSELDGLAIAAEGYELIGKLEPKYVIPLGEGEALKKFIDEMGATAGEKQTKLKISSKDAPEETTVVVLDPSN